MRRLIYALLIYTILFELIPNMQHTFYGGRVVDRLVQVAILAIQVLLLFRIAAYVKSRAIEAPRNFVHVFLAIGCMAVVVFTLVSWIYAATQFISEALEIRNIVGWWIAMPFTYLRIDPVEYTIYALVALTVFVCEWPLFWAAVPRAQRSASSA